MAKTRGQGRTKRQPKQPDKYDPAKQGKQTSSSDKPAQDDTARDAAMLLKATRKQATKVKADWKGKAFRKALYANKKLTGSAGTGTVFMEPGA